MSSENKQSSNPLYVPQFTPANYGSFFLAGQLLYLLVKRLFVL